MRFRLVPPASVLLCQCAFRRYCICFFSSSKKTHYIYLPGCLCLILHHGTQAHFDTWEREVTRPKNYFAATSKVGLNNINSLSVILLLSNLLLKLSKRYAISQVLSENMPVSELLWRRSIKVRNDQQQ